MIEKIRTRIAAQLGDVDPATLLFALAAALIAGGILKDLLLLAVGRDRELANLLAFLTFDSGTDSWMPMYRAVDLFRSDPDAALYQTVFFDQMTKFQYPPTSLLPFVALSTLGLSTDAGVSLMQIVTWFGVLAIIVVTAMIYLDQRTLPGLAGFRARPHADVMVIGGIAVAILSFDPVTYAYEVGQIQVLLDLAVGGALLLWLKDRKGAAGAVMALAALVKPQYGVVILWSLLRREHRFSIGFLATGAPIGLISLAVFGLAEHFAYLEVISFIGRHGEVFWANQSINGLLNRLLVDADAMTWNAEAFAPFHPLVYAGTLLSTVAFVLLGLGYRPRWTRRKENPPAEAARQESALDLATMIVALTLASPIAWEHHYGVTAPIMALAFLNLVDLKVRTPVGASGKRVDLLLVGLAISYALVSNYLTQLFPVAGTPLNILQSYQLFGGLALLWVLAGARAALNPAVEPLGAAAAAKSA